MVCSIWSTSTIHKTLLSTPNRSIWNTSSYRILLCPQDPQQQQRLGSVAPSTAAWQATIGSPSLSSSPSTPSSTPSSSPSVHGNLLYIPFKMVSLHHQDIYNFTSSAFPKDLFSLNQKKILFLKQTASCIFSRWHPNPMDRCSYPPIFQGRSIFWEEEGSKCPSTFLFLLPLTKILFIWKKGCFILRLRLDTSSSFHYFHLRQQLEDINGYYGHQNLGADLSSYVAVVGAPTRWN